MSFPDYEGKDYSDSDQDDPDITSERVPQDQRTVNLHTTDVMDDRIAKDVTQVPHQVQTTSKDISEGQEGGQVKTDIERPIHVRSMSSSNENDAGALNDLLDDYDYTSQPTTPAVTTGGFPEHQSSDNQSEPVKAQDTSISPIYTSTVTNIRRVDPNPAATDPSTLIQPDTKTTAMPSSKSNDETSFIANLTKSLDSVDPSNIISTEPPAVSTHTSRDPSIQPKSTQPTAPPAADLQSTSNYWAQMRANLKAKRNVSNDMSRTSSSKTGDSSIEDARKTPSPLPHRSSTDSSHSNKAQPVVSNDGRSGSFTSYTPLPKFPETRRPSVPTISTQGIPYGRPSRPTIDTGVRSGSFSSSPVEIGQGRRGSASDAKRPIMDPRGSGNRSASNSPVTGSMPFSNQGSRSRASSRSRTMDQAIIGNLPLPVFAPREGLPEIRGPSERTGRPQSPAGRTSPGRPQSPGRGVSPSRGLPPPRPQSPARGISSGQNTQQGRDQGRGFANRTPSPLKNVPAEKRENLSREPGRTPSPAKDTTLQREGDNQTVSNQVPSPPTKDVPVDTEPAPVALPNPAELVPNDISSKATLPPTPEPPVNHSLSAQPLSPQPQKNVALQYTLPSVNLPTPSQQDISRTITPSSDAERTPEDDRQGNANVPPEKRITVFLQEAGKRKESQGLPPLPSEPVPPLPPPHARASVIPESQKAAPVQRLEKYVQQEPPSPLIPPPSAPILASKLTQSERDEDSDSLDESPPNSPAKQSKVDEVTLPQPTTNVAIPATNHMITPLSSDPDHKPHTSLPPPTSIPPPVPQLGTPTTPVTERNVASPSGLRLPELDALRPITWGPLAFGGTPHQTPEKSAHQTPVKSVMEPLDNVDEESDWEKDDEEIIEEKPEQTIEVKQQQEEIDNWESEVTKLTTSENVSDFEREEADQNRYVPEESSKLPRVVEEVNSGPGYSSADEENISNSRLDKGKGKEVYHGETPTSSQPTSPQTFNYPDPVPRSKFIDRDITSFFASNVIMSAESPRSQTPTQTRPPLQTQPVPSPPKIQPVPLNYLPDFMSGKDIPELSTVAQRVGAYQSRREQMARADTGLRGWLLQFQQTQPHNLSLQTPPNIKRLSKESYGTAPSPITGSLPFGGGSNVTRKMISKMKIGGKKISAATKNTMKLGSSTGDRRSYDEMDYARRSSEARRNSPREPLAPSPASQRASVDSPAVSRSEFSPQAEFKGDTYRDPEPRTSGSGQQDYYEYSNERQPMGLGLTAPHEPYANEGPSQSTTSFPNHARMEPEHQPSPYVQPASTVMSKKEGGRHGFSASISGGASKLFGMSNESKTKHHSGSAEYSPPQPQSSSPKQKSKFSKFVNDLSHSTITGSKHTHSGSQSRIVSSPTRPPPPDKSQFRVTSEGSSSKVKGFFADLGSRDITGARISDKQTSPRQQTTIPVGSEDRTGGVGNAGFGRIFSDLSKRDITGATEQERLEAARRRQQESTHLPAQPMVYDENSSDWEVKLEQMEDVLPHIRREMLADALKQAGGDEQRAIGLAVINSR